MAQRDRREYRKHYYLTHGEHELAYAKQRYALHAQVRKQQMSANNQRYYQVNPPYYSERARKREQEIREFIQQQKVGLSCIRCGNSDIRVLDFHHLDKISKEIGISNIAYKGWGQKRILQEIAKCEVLCANCHRILHWEERNGG
jgi:hypothetical protein